MKVRRGWNQTARMAQVFVLALATFVLACRPGGQPKLPKALTLNLGGDVKMEFVLIRPGSFLMGSEQGGNNEKPVHKVTITKPFYLGKYEVTQQQWDALMGDNPSQFKGPTKPVDNVRWDECQAFMEKLGEKFAEMEFRFPSEAEWEYACRAGSTTHYCYGDADTSLSEYAWYAANSDEKSHPVGEKKPNAWGLYDMHGNVWEWCAERFAENYPGGDLIDPTGPATGTLRVVRGGARNSSASLCRSTFRVPVAPDYVGPSVGLRLVGGVRARR